MRHDPRLSEFFPKCDATDYEIATSGTALKLRHLWEQLDSLRAVLEAQAALPLREAILQYVEAVSGQLGKRLGALLARTGLSGTDPVTGAEAGKMLCVTQQRISQIVRQLHRRTDLARPPAGIWMPQIAAAESDGWRVEFSVRGIEAIRSLSRSQ
ncbi:MAG: hypothetical protein IIC71_02905 [Acidobacteria bacterium]|nr:hypothetical protein [Acidobacteriota bacterium]